MAEEVVKSKAAIGSAARRAILHEACEAYGLDPKRIAQFFRESLEVSAAGLQGREISGCKDEEYIQDQMVWNEANVLLQFLDLEAVTKTK